MSSRLAHTLLCAASLLALAACAKSPAKVADSTAPGAAVATAPDAPTIVTVYSSDYAYQAPDTITAGMVTLKLIARGPDLKHEYHHIQLLRFKDGKTYADFANGMKDMRADAPPPPWAEWLTGPIAPSDTNTSQSITQELVAGEYALVCYASSKDHVPHYNKGMIHKLTVRPATGAVAAAPTADVRIIMSDYAWDIQPAITTGKHVVRIENVAAQPHEMFIVKLEKGKVPMDFITWYDERNGPPPVSSMGGSTSMNRGAVAYLSLDLAPGEYGLLCFVTDAKDGQPHFVHGMVKTFTIT